MADADPPQKQKEQESCGERLASMLPDGMECAPPPEGKRLLTKEEVKALSDEDFFEAYREGIIPRPAGALTDPDKWEEQIEKIPLFMTREPTQEEIDSNPTLSAIQSLIEESTPDEQAKYHKEHGNEAYKKARQHKDKKVRAVHLRKAIEIYDQGIAVVPKCTDSVLVATLYTNRAACNLLLGNNRRVINDCETACKHDPKNIKAYYRAASALKKLEKHDELIDWCDRGLQIDPTSEELTTLRAEAVKAKATAAKQQRMREREQRKKEMATKKLADTIAARKVVMRGAANTEAAPEDARVVLDAEGLLHWPVVFFYPEHHQTDFVKDFREDHTFANHLEIMFPNDGPCVAWDSKQQYRQKNLSVYCELTKDGRTKTTKLKQTDSLRSALALDGYIVQGHTPAFYVLVAGSEFEAEFLQKQRDA